MSSTNIWYKKYVDNVDQVFWTLLRWGFGETNISIVRNPGRGAESELIRLYMDIEKDVYPETILYGLAKCYANYYDPLISDMISNPNTDNAVRQSWRAFLSCFGVLNEAKIKAFFEKNYGRSFKGNSRYQNTDGVMELYEDGALPSSMKAFLEKDENKGNAKVLEKEYRISVKYHNFYIRLGYEVKQKIATHDNRAFIVELKKLLENAVDNKTVLPIMDVIDLCMDFVEGKKGQTEPKNEQLSLDLMAKSYFDYESKIMDKVKGQDAAIKKFLRGLFHGEMRYEKNGPKATYLFMGPPGVGKTFLAKTAGDILGMDYKIFQMNEYADDEAYCGLVGFSQTWKNSKPGELTSYVEAHPNSVIVIDEIEKAHYNTVTQFLSVLEGGFLRDLYTEEDVDFTNTILIFTTNAGRDYYEKSRGEALSLIPENTLIDALKNEKKGDGSSALPPELISRLAKGTIICFDYMNPVKLVPMIKDSMDAAKNSVEKKLGIKCSYDSALLPYLFMYYLGSKLDARVAVERSNSFVQDNIYSVIERMGADPELYAGCDTNAVDIQVDREEIINDYIEMNQKKIPIIMVISKEDQELFKHSKADKYKCFFISNKTDKDTDEDKQKVFADIEKLLKKHPDIEAVFVDPFITVEGDVIDDPENYEGINYMQTFGNDVLQWMLSKDDMPHIYVLEGKREFTPLDRRDLSSKGVKEIVSVRREKNIKAVALKSGIRIDKDAEISDAKMNRIRKAIADGCRNKINQVIYERFLLEKLESLTSKGRSIDFSIDQTVKPEGITIRIHDYKFVNNMDADARDVVVNDPEKASDGFDDVIGNESAKEELRRFIRFLKDPKEYARTGMKISRGILLYGPPGTGKTMLARCLAAEADCPFIAVTGAQFVEGSRKIEEVFKLARKYAPSVVFIDEIDAFALDRETGGGVRTLINELLTEMDGFDSKSDRPVFVVAATNAASAPNLSGNNVRLDKALLRRFSKKVYIDLPNKEERKKTFEMRKKKLENARYNLNAFTEEDIDHLVNVTIGRSIDNIDSAISLAQGKAAEKDCELNLELLVDAIEEDVYGEKTDITDEEIWSTAYHEAGHAILHFVEGDEPECASLIARGPYLGFVSPKDTERMGYTKAQLLGEIRILLAGRAAEIVKYGPEAGLSTGASNDLERATGIARKIIGSFGMDDEFLPTIEYLPLFGGEVDALQLSPLAPLYFEKINNILRNELKNTIEILDKNKSSLDKLATELHDKFRLTTEDMRACINLKK